MSALGLAEFRDYFAAIHGCAPFPWQERLMARVLNPPNPGTAWPEAITLPTASGKTACLDIAIFALGTQAELPPQQRTAPRRVCFVVDRRVIVAEAFERAKRIAQALRNPSSPILREIARLLGSLTGGDGTNPLAVFQMRGGLYRDHTWARTPAQPTVICSTVDQLGSRLLFRGYGVRDLTRPIHAALTGNDTLIFLDEAHVAQPFLETARSVARYRAYAARPLALPFHFVVMSATPPADCVDRFPATPEEMAPDLAHEVLGPRLHASKPARLVVAQRASGRNFAEPLAKVLVRQAEALVGEGQKVVAILVNRVATARFAYELLGKKHAGRAVLFTGRMRPVDREAVLVAAQRDFALGTGLARQRQLAAPVFIVATQCLEVGADMDFDGLVTECASLDALRQRFGRLNRGGRPVAARGVVVIRGDQIEPSADHPDPVYGTALPATWAWLKENGANDEVDFGVEAMRTRLDALTAEQLAAMRVESSHAPVVLPAHADCWAQTSPEPCPSPDVAPFLHGSQRGEAEVALCWRADLPELAAPDATKRCADLLNLCPPAAAECIGVPLWRVREWLRGTPASDGDSADADGSEPSPEHRENRESLRPAFCWRGQDESFFVRQPEDLRPGDTLVFNIPDGVQEWLGSSQEQGPSIDVGDRVQLTARARPTLRLHPNTLSAWPDCAARRRLQALASSADLEDRLAADEAMLRDEFSGLLTELAAQLPAAEHAWLRDTALALVKEFGDRRRFRRAIHAHPSGSGLVLRSQRRYRRVEEEAFAESGFGSSTASEAVTLARHTAGVVRLARQFAHTCGLGEELAQDLALAARFHDLGKADPRFQAMLRGLTVRMLASGASLLAKSARLALTAAERETIRELAGYPQGGRHELLSLRLAESNPASLATAHDPDLVLHLVASHHGYCRPFAPVVEDEAPPALSVTLEGQTYHHTGATGLEDLSSGTTDRFWRLVRRYGWWGLAYLETILRLADQRQSEAEQFGEP